MCGIVGYIGSRNAREIILKALKRLEYRGYDSAGVAIVSDGIKVDKRKGRIEELDVNFDGTMGIGHTRWATHGKPDDMNAHPFLDCEGEIAIVHNGIIENYMKLREDVMSRGHRFSSETDSEVVAHLIEEKMNGSFRDAFLNAIRELEGSFAILAIHRGERRIMAAKKESPLIVGLGDGENFLASDIPAFLEYTNRAIVLRDGDACEITENDVRIMDFQGNPVSRDVQEIDWKIEDAEKAGYKHFMLKEIFEQPRAVDETLYSLLSRDLNNLDFERLSIVACGTSYHAGLVGKYIIEELMHVPVEVHYASEYKYRPDIRDSSAVLFITQSGETADTLGAARKAREMGLKTMAITNVVGSSITNYVDSVIYTVAGPEIGVAATKTFTTQILTLYHLAIEGAKQRGEINAMEKRELLREMRKLPYTLERVLSLSERIRKEAEKIKDASSMFYIARGLNYPIALEGALKMKEISYIHAEGYPAGELKHGPLALLDSGVPVVALVPEDSLYSKMLSNVKEVKAREAYTITVSSSEELSSYGDSLIKIPKVHPLFYPFPNIVVLQLLAYHTADLLGREIDKPKNLAKSVTVE